MRVWDIHPGYLSRQSLLGQHAEIHALFVVIENGKKGYAAHPETLRWKEWPGGLTRAHDLAVLEMQLRGYNHASPLPPSFEAERKNQPAAHTRVYIDHPVEQVAILSQKYLEREQSGRIPLPKNVYQFWANCKYSVMARGYNHYKHIQALLRGEDSCPLDKSGLLFEQILNLMELPVRGPALANVTDHLWGYFKREASAGERERYMARQSRELPELIRFLYRLAVKYQRPYLLHSTIFADFTAIKL